MLISHGNACNEVCSNLRNSTEGDIGRSRDIYTEVEEEGINVLDLKTQRGIPVGELAQAETKVHERAIWA